MVSGRWRCTAAADVAATTTTATANMTATATTTSSAAYTATASATSANMRHGAATRRMTGRRSRWATRESAAGS